jgi:ectoine hydroxylase-related dioxygenase (phytanoyl-CoA dioxygenase family)
MMQNVNPDARIDAGRNAPRGLSLAGAAPIPEPELAEYRYALTALGYAVVPNALPADSCEELKRLLQTVIDAHVPAASERSVLDRYLMHDLLCRQAAFAALLEDPRLQQLLAPFLGEHWIMYAFTSSSLPPGETNYGHRLHVDSPRFIAGYATNMGVMWALDDFQAENGATEVLPGSHVTALEPTPELFARHKVVLSADKGAMMVFNARLFHRSGVNRTRAWRHALTMNACRSFMKQRMDWVRFVPREIAAALNAQGRRLLGYDTRLPASLEELNLPEDRRLYKPGQG